MTSGGAVEAVCRYAGQNVLSYLVLLTYFMDLHIKVKTGCSTLTTQTTTL